MENASQTIWPGGVPVSLWSYDRQLPGQIDSGLPLTNIPVDGTLLMNFGIGVVVIWLYAWNRFNKRSYEPTPFDYRVLRELLPAQMRDPLLLQRAYVLYALSLTLIYAALSFFGGIILGMARTLPTVGPQFSVDPELVGSAQWPLILALAMAGLTQLIAPLDHLERSLRRYVHRQLGIPILVKEYTRRFIDLQLRQIQERKEYAKLGGKGGFVLRDWAQEEITQTYGVEDVRAKAELSWRMIDGLRAAGWPNASVRDDTRQSVARELREAWTSTLYLSDLIVAPRQTGEGDLGAAKAPPMDAVPADAAPPEPAKAAQNADGAARTQAEVAATPPAQADAAAGETKAPAAVDSPPEVQRTRQEQQLVNAVDSMERHLYEMGAIYAIYAQRDREFDGIPDPALQAAVQQVFGREAYGPSVRQALCCAVVVFFAYLVGMYATNQDLLTKLPLNIWTAGLSALYETLRTLSIYMWPALLAIYATTPSLEARAAAPPVTGRALAALIWGGLAGAMLMAMVALLYTWIVARNSDVFMRQLFGRFSETDTSSNLLYYQSYTPIAALVAGGVVLARLPRSMAGHVLAMAVVAVSASVLAKLREVLLYPGSAGCNRTGGTFGLPECLAYNFVDLLTPAVVVLFLCQRAGRDSAAPKKAAGVREGATRAVMVALLAAGLLGPMAGRSQAEQALAASVQFPPGAVQPFDVARAAAGAVWAFPVARETVRLGFREDVPPFSYRNTAGGTARFKGYIADLCYAIFAGEDYQVEVKKVTVAKRFEDLGGVDGAMETRQIDVLCDPVTLRYEDAARWRNGIFSPVVFASSVTYLRRTLAEGSGPQQMLLGYVRGTTAAEVVREFCRGEGRNDCTLPEESDGVERAPEACARPDPDQGGPAKGAEENAADGGSFWKRFLSALGKNDRAADKKAAANAVTFFACPQSSHSELVKWFCKTRSDAPVRFYFGDNEIIRRSHQDWQKAHGRCPIEPVGPAVTYEPYALLTTLARPDLAQFVQRRIYEIFSDANRIQGIFSASFDGSQMTPPLAYLFLLNGVTGPQRTQRVDCGPRDLNPACAR